MTSVFNCVWSENTELRIRRWWMRAAIPCVMIQNIVVIDDRNHRIQIQNFPSAFLYRFLLLWAPSLPITMFIKDEANIVEYEAFSSFELSSEASKRRKSERRSHASLSSLLNMSPLRQETLSLLLKIATFCTEGERDLPWFLLHRRSSAQRSSWLLEDCSSMNLYRLHQEMSRRDEQVVRELLDRPKHQLVS